MMWGYNDGATWLWMVPMMVAVVALIGALAIFLFRALRPGDAPADRPMEALRQRLASGEITPEQFEQTRVALKG